MRKSELFRQPEVRQLQKLHRRAMQMYRAQQKRGIVNQRPRRPVTRADLARAESEFRILEEYVAVGRAADKDPSGPLAIALRVLVSLEHHRDAYLLSKNPAFAFLAWGLHLNYRVPLPAWARRYFEANTRGFEASGPLSGAAMAQRLGLGGKRAADITLRHVEIALELCTELTKDTARKATNRRSASELNEVLDTVSERMNVGFDLVKKIYYTCHKVGLLGPDQNFTYKRQR